mgnify:FL=1
MARQLTDHTPRFADSVRMARRWTIAVVMLGSATASLTGCHEHSGAPPAASTFAEVGDEATPQLAAPPAEPAPATESSLDDTVPSEVDAGTTVGQQTVSAPVFRPDDARPLHDDQRAEALGILRYESTHLLLYTDIDPQVARTLPPLMDQAYGAFVEYFGPLPPAQDGAEYQMTGYIMADQDRFREAGMLPQQADDLLVHGIHRGSEFWMNDQEYNYYRRHLMIHEGTHCFMTVLGGPRPSQWYMEGMAEYFGTHTIDDGGNARFGVMPADPIDYVGFGRVEMLRDDVSAGNFRPVSGMLALDTNDFVSSRREPYAWSWAFCKFLDASPRSQSRFRRLIDYQHAPAFNERTKELLAPVADELQIEWELFVRNLEYGYDVERAAIDFWRGSPLAADAAATFDLQADKGWQSSGVWVEKGTPYRISAEGEVTLALEPRPWISQPQGVSIRYSAGLPIGRVVAAILSDAPPGPDGEGTLWRVIDIGRGAELTPESAGTLYLRVNDNWNSLRYNAGAYQLRVERM